MTGFADDDSISVWAKPYVASALRAGMVQGTEGDGTGAEFAPDRVSAQTEAAVMLNRLRPVSAVAATGAVSQDAAPALTRAQAAEMLLAALDVLYFRERIW